MIWLSSLTFLEPHALWALLLLPFIWILLQLTPPRPKLLSFPPVRILFGLKNKQHESDKSPIWLLLLRLSLVTSLILAAARPTLNSPGFLSNTQAPMLLILDNGWAAASSWEERIGLATKLSLSARNRGRLVSFATTAPGTTSADLTQFPADQALGKISALEPHPFDKDMSGLLKQLQTKFSDLPELQIFWLSDGLNQTQSTQFIDGLKGLAQGKAEINLFVPKEKNLPVALKQPELTQQGFKITGLRAAIPFSQSWEVRALTCDDRELGRQTLNFPEKTMTASANIALPLPLRNQIERLEIVKAHNAGAVFLLDNRSQRKSIALQAGIDAQAEQPLLGSLYYISRALETAAEMSIPASAQELKQQIDAGLSMLISADGGAFNTQMQSILIPWIDQGGILVRFAGAHMSQTQDELMPVKLRLSGDRFLGSAFGWQTPQALQNFSKTSPFHDLEIDEEIRVTRQILAEAEQNLSEKIWASLADGTPLVTATNRGKGWVILFHITANTDWSNLPLSGLFPAMLQRILTLSPNADCSARFQTHFQPSDFTPFFLLDGFGNKTLPSAETPSLSSQSMEAATSTLSHPMGIYVRGGTSRAINLRINDEDLKMLPPLDKIIIRDHNVLREDFSLTSWLLLLSLGLFALDCIALLFLQNRLDKKRFFLSLMPLFLIMLTSSIVTTPSWAQTIPRSLSLSTHFAYVKTGDAEVDAISAEGLKGLNRLLEARTSVHPAEPIGIDIEVDETAFFPLIYWPVLTEAPALSETARTHMQNYMKNGGVFLFDLRQTGMGLNQGQSSETLRRLLAGLEIPPIEPVFRDHVLTKSFYLLNEFPGRYGDGALWIVANRETSEADGVSPLLITANDFAAAWAMDDQDQPLYATIPSSDAQREMAYRAGINIVIYVLTGNYKADQVHIKDILERLGQ